MQKTPNGKERMLGAWAKTPETCLQDSSWSQMGQKTQRSREIRGNERKAQSVPHSSTAAARKIHVRTQITVFPCKGCGA